ncbi:tyrosine-type recombinase/integrase [Iningainema sp. BLCCT55]|uniref:Tyrosine-type recombinase/integrase n=2 Tax=Iningainema TaxID=1932705 RepID=A0A8J6XT72_9CYAN|nr:tyrosine-type recombinase/integrase [Iningainema tapete BLCC-T55]
MWVYSKAENTKATYKDYITRFLAFVAKPLPLVSLEDLYDFAAHLNEQGLAQSSQKTILYAVKSLLTFAHKLGVTPVNVGAALALGKTPDTLNERLLSESEVTRLIWNGEENPRNRAILRLLYGAGLRVSELCALKWKDCTPRGDSGQVTVMGKGGKVRSVLLPKSIWSELVQLRSNCSDGDPVFCSRKGKGKGHLDRKTINKIIAAATKRAGLTQKVSPHWLRHAHASHALERGANVGLVKETLGHSNVSVTSRYLHARPNDSSAMYLPL